MKRKALLLTGWTVLVAVISALITTAYFHAFVLNPGGGQGAELQPLRELTAEQLANSPVKDNDSIIVVFSYACSFCSAREQDLLELEKRLPVGKSLKHVHITGDDNQLTRYAPIFATLTTLGIEPQQRDNAFFAVLTKQRDLTDTTIRNQWLEENGIDRSAYEAASNSPETLALLEEMRAITDHYKIHVTPTYIVGRKWVVIQDRPTPEFMDYLVSLLDQTQG